MRSGGQILVRLVCGVSSSATRQHVSAWTPVLSSGSSNGGRGGWIAVAAAAAVGVVVSASEAVGAAEKKEPADRKSIHLPFWAQSSVDGHGRPVEAEEALADDDDDDDDLLRSTVGRVAVTHAVHAEHEVKDAVHTDLASGVEGGGKSLQIITGNSNPELARAIAGELYHLLAKAEVIQFADGETSVKLEESVRGSDVFIVQSTAPPVNQNLMELLLMISTVRRTSAKRITAVIPYYGYKRDVGLPESTPEVAARLIEDQTTTTQTSRAQYPISAADVATMLEEMGVDRILSVELQPPGHGQIEGFFGVRVAVDSLRATSLAVRHFAKKGLHNVVVVAPHDSCVELALDFQTGLRRMSKRGTAAAGLKTTKLAVIVHGGASRGMDRYLTMADTPYLVGDVKGKDVVMVDDLVDSGISMSNRVQYLLQQGANRVFVYATHGMFNGDCLARVETCGLEKIVITDTVRLPKHVVDHPKVEVLSVAPILAAAVKRLHTGESLQDMRIFSRDNVIPRYHGQGT